MTEINFGRVAWRATMLLLSACSAPLSMDADPQPAVTAALTTDAGSPAAFFTDSLENTAPGWWFSSTDRGNGYTSTRAGAHSPTRVGDEYSNRNPSGQSQSLSRRFVLPAATLTGCTASVWIDPLTAVSGKLEIDDAVTKAPLRSGSFSLAATKTWTLVSTDGAQLGSPSRNDIIVRVALLGNGEWQEFLFDDLSGSCTLP
jgi:hypothetical protein